jgi:hypothetical protein
LFHSFLNIKQLVIWMSVSLRDIGGRIFQRL